MVIVNYMQDYIVCLPFLPNRHVGKVITELPCELQRVVCLIISINGPFSFSPLVWPGNNFLPEESLGALGMYPAYPSSSHIPSKQNDSVAFCFPNVLHSSIYGIPSSAFSFPRFRKSAPGKISESWRRTGSYSRCHMRIQPSYGGDGSARFPGASRL